MGRFKRKYTFEQLMEQLVDASLSVFPPEHRQELRAPLLQAVITNASFDIMDRRRDYPERVVGHIINHGSAHIGPTLLDIFYVGGAQGVLTKLRTLDFNIQPNKPSRALCMCKVCMRERAMGRQG